MVDGKRCKELTTCQSIIQFFLVVVFLSTIEIVQDESIKNLVQDLLMKVLCSQLGANFHCANNSRPFVYASELRDVNKAHGIINSIDVRKVASFLVPIKPIESISNFELSLLLTDL